MPVKIEQLPLPDFGTEPVVFFDGLWYRKRLLADGHTVIEAQTTPFT
jgi:hypothetical protein